MSRYTWMGGRRLHGPLGAHHTKHSQSNVLCAYSIDSVLVEAQGLLRGEVTELIGPSASGKTQVASIHTSHFHKISTITHTHMHTLTVTYVAPHVFVAKNTLDVTYSINLFDCPAVPELHPSSSAERRQLSGRP